MQTHVGGPGPSETPPLHRTELMGSVVPQQREAASIASAKIAANGSARPKQPNQYTKKNDPDRPKQPNQYTKQPNQYTKQPNQYTKQPNQYTKQPNQYTKQPNQYTKHLVSSPTSTSTPVRPKQPNQYTKARDMENQAGAAEVRPGQGTPPPTGGAGDRHHALPCGILLPSPWTDGLERFSVLFLLVLVR